MPITKVGSVITETAPTGFDTFFRAGCVPASQFAIKDDKDQIKQIKFDCSALTTNSTLTIAAPSGTSSTITLPSSFVQQGTQTIIPASNASVTVLSSTSTLIIDGATADGTGFTITLPTTPSDGYTLNVISSSIGSIGAVTVAAGAATKNSYGFTRFDPSSKTFYALVYKSATTTWYVGNA